MAVHSQYDKIVIVISSGECRKNLVFKVGVSELHEAYQKWRSTKGFEPLLLFYAVECGLKHVYLKRHNLRNTDDLSDDLRSHDLEKLIEELKISRNVVDTPPKFKCERDSRKPKINADSQPHPIGVAHEAWRYGVIIETEDEQKLIDWLNSVSRWIEEKIDDR
jgi:hypothetical protein